MNPISIVELKQALSIRDLTDPSSGPHALQQLLDQITSALRHAWGCELQLHRRSPIVSVADNYDRLHYPKDGAARDERYTRYVCEGALLRTQTSAMIPPLLRELSNKITDALLVCPGLVYRRDCIDRLHTGEPHQVDLWRLRSDTPLTPSDLSQMIALVVQSALPGRSWRVIPATHPYTTDGLQIEVREGDDWIEIGECGLALPALLQECGHNIEHTSGLAMGLGLDRILMLRKGLNDIRLLRSNEPRITSQMSQLSPYHPVSVMPPVRRDLSLSLAHSLTPEELGDQIRSLLQENAEVVESVEILSETPYEALHQAARERLGISPGQLNLLVRVTLRSMQRSLTNTECNALRDVIYDHLHQGAPQR